MELKDVVFAQLKPEFIYRGITDEVQSAKKPRLDKPELKLPPEIKQQLCRELCDVGVDDPPPACKVDHCRYSHDIKKYLEKRPPDIGPECYLFKLKGRCPLGMTCMFGSSHITDTGRNLVDKEAQQKYEESGQKIKCYIKEDVMDQLRNQEYDFRASEEVLRTLPKAEGPNWMIAASDIDFTEDVDFPKPEEELLRPLDRLGPCVDSADFRDFVSKKKQIDWTNKLYLPSILNVTCLPFRRICKDLGADITCSEPIAASYLLEGVKFEWMLAQRHSSEDVYGIHIFGFSPQILTRAAQLISDQMDVDFIELSVGLSQHQEHYKWANPLPAPIVKCLARVSPLPLTLSVHHTEIGPISPILRACNLSMVHLNPRISPYIIEWDRIGEPTEALQPIPVFVTSDIFSYKEYEEILDQTGVSGVTFIRAAMVKPWIFTEIKEQKVWDISSAERFEYIKKFVNYGLEYWGSHHRGVEQTRKFLLDLLSYLCHYIPVGLLERPPQRLHDRCARFVGRDDLETMLGGAQPSDWLKISEMLLGPVPDGYHYHMKFRNFKWPVRS